MTTQITVSNLTQLNSALATARGGETIKLEDGHYGSLSVSKDFASTVKIEAINPLSATFTDIDVPGGSYIHFDGLTINGQPRVDKSAHHVTFANNDLKGGLYFRDADNIVVHENDISGGFNTLTLNDVTNFTITENEIHHAESDVVRITGASQYGLFENNFVHEVAAVRPYHPDLMQVFGTSDGDPSDITIRGNHFYDDPKTGDVYAQGIFFGNIAKDGFKNILIEDNLINVGSPNSIFVNGGQENVVIKNNTLIPWPGDGGAIIRILDKEGYANLGTSVYDNVAKLILNEGSNVDVGDNYLYGRNADLGALFSGDGNVWQDFKHVDGSPIDLSTGLGASARLLELLGGGNDSAPAPTPAPTPVEEPEPDAGNNEDDAPNTPAPQPAEPNTSVEWPDMTEIATNKLVAFSMIGDYQFNRKAADVVETAHNDKLSLDAATIALTFNADSVSGQYGLISKDASNYHGGGNHVVSYIDDGTLVVRFQDGSLDEVVRVNGIEANTDYDLQINFGDDQIAVWLDGNQVHSESFSTNWSGNVEHLQIGANGWASNSGEAGFGDVFDGTVSNVVIVEGSYSPTELNKVLTEGEPTSLPVDDSNSGSSAVFEMPLERQFNGRTDSIVNIEHEAKFELAEGTIAFTFNADDLNGLQGLVSKDAGYYSGGGNHVSAMLNSNEFVIRFQDNDSDASFDFNNVKAGEDYNVQTWFGDGEVGLAINGQLVGVKDFDIDLSQNGQNLQFGGLGWMSEDGGAAVGHAFDGTISDVMIFDTAMSLTDDNLFI